MVPFTRLHEPLNVVLPNEAGQPLPMRPDSDPCVPRQRDGEHRQNQRQRAHSDNSSRCAFREQSQPPNNQPRTIPQLVSERDDLGPRRRMKKGTGSEQGTGGAPRIASPLGACPLFHQAEARRSKSRPFKQHEPSNRGHRQHDSNRPLRKHGQSHRRTHQCEAPPRPRHDPPKPARCLLFSLAPRPSPLTPLSSSDKGQQRHRRAKDQRRIRRRRAADHGEHQIRRHRQTGPHANLGAKQPTREMVGGQ